MKTNRYVTQSAVVLGLFALLTVPQVIGQADEATAPVPTASTETVADSGASVVSGQGTSGTAVQGGTETVSATPTTVATNASTEPSANTSTTQASQEASAVLTNANQVTPAVPVQVETVTEPAHEGQTVDMQILSTTDLHTNLVNYDYYQDKPSQTVGGRRDLFVFYCHQTSFSKPSGCPVCRSFAAPPRLFWPSVASPQP